MLVRFSQDSVLHAVAVWLMARVPLHPVRLHRGVYACSTELALGARTDKCGLRMAMRAHLMRTLLVTPAQIRAVLHGPSPHAVGPWHTARLGD